MEIFGSNSSLSRACGVNVSGVLYVVEGTVNLDADITYCIDADTVWLTGGELYCSTSQGGVFARACKIHIHGGEFHAFDGGTWGQFIYDGVTVEKGVIYVAEDGKNKFETAVKWDGEKSLNTYDAVWILPEKDDTDDSDYLLGDVNNDGTVDSTDYLRIKSHFLGTITLEGKEFKAGDVDSSGTIDSTDYLRIKSHFFGEYDLHK